MPKSQADRDATDSSDGASNASQVGGTRRLLRAVHQAGAPSHDRLSEEINRLNPGKQHDPSELVELSVKMSTHGFFQRRHGGSISWEKKDRGQLAESARKAAPTDALQRAFAAPATPHAASSEATTATSPVPPSVTKSEQAAQAIRAWAARSSRYFSAIAYDFDAQLYKLYLFKHHPVQFLEDLDLVLRLPELPALSYIRSLEVAMDDPAQWKESLYFKLRFLAAQRGDATDSPASLLVRRKPTEVLAADFRPHPLLSPRLLAQVPAREALVNQLGVLLADLPVINDPVVKFTPPVLELSTATPEHAAQAWAEVDYGLNLNLLDPEKTRFVEEQEATLLAIADALGCKSQAKAWLAQIAPFDCFLSYLGLGSDSVTLYYRSTTQRCRKTAPQLIRKRDQPGGAPKK